MKKIVLFLLSLVMMSSIVFASDMCTVFPQNIWVDYDKIYEVGKPIPMKWYGEDGGRMILKYRNTINPRVVIGDEPYTDIQRFDCDGNKTFDWIPNEKGTFQIQWKPISSTRFGDTTVVDTLEVRPGISWNSLDDYYVKHEDLPTCEFNPDDYYTQIEVDDLISQNTCECEQPDMTQYYTKTEVDSLVADLQAQIDSLKNQLITYPSIEYVDNSISAIEIPDTSELVTVTVLEHKFKNWGQYSRIYAKINSLEKRRADAEAKIEKWEELKSETNNRKRIINLDNSINKYENYIEIWDNQIAELNRDIQW